jgi:cytochrome c oxidase subunit 2
MWFNLPLFPERAATLANQVDYLFFFLLANLIFFCLVVFLGCTIFMIRYRRSKHPKAVQQHGSLLLELTWTLIPFGIAMVMFGWGSVVFFNYARPPANSLEVYAVGKQWMWKFQHMEGPREIDQLHVPVGRNVRVIMTSQDVIHDFSVPAFRLKGDVIPGRYTNVWFNATRTGTFHLFCDQYCGTLHSGMIGDVFVMTPDDYERWLAAHGEGSMAQQGQKLFQQLGCNTCHRSDSQARGPNLNGLFGNPIHLQDGRIITADEDYIRECITHPNALRVVGWQPIMPSFQGQISEEGIIELIAYIKSMRGEITTGPVKTSPGSSEVPGANPPVKVQ